MALVSGKSVADSIEPVRNAHIDMNNKGLRDTARFCRHEIWEAGKQALDAEDAGDQAPRYAAYSIWASDISSLYSRLECKVSKAKKMPWTDNRKANPVGITMLASTANRHPRSPSGPVRLAYSRPDPRSISTTPKTAIPPKTPKGEFMNTIRMVLPPKLLPLQQQK
jgi:hypothetical protein